MTLKRGIGERGPPQHGAARIAFLVIAFAAILVAAYALGGFFAVPWLINQALARYEISAPERRARIAGIRLNPFTLEAVVETAEISDAGAGFSFSADSVRLDLSPRSLLERRPVLDIIAIERPVLRLDSPETDPLPDWPSLSPRLVRLELRRGAFELLDSANSRGLAFADISVTATNLGGWTHDSERTSEPGRFALGAVETGGAEIALQGSLTPDGRRAQGRFEINGVDLGSLRPWLGAALGSLSPQGRVDWSGEYLVNLDSTGPELEIVDARAEAAEFAISPAPGITVNATQVSAIAHGTFSNDEGEIRAAGSLQISDAALEFLDARLSPALSVGLSRVTAGLSGDTSAQLVGVELQGELDSAGRVSLNTEISTEPGPQRRVSLQLRDIPATVLSPYAQQSFARAIDDGRAGLDLDYDATGSEPIVGNVHLVLRELRLAPMEPDSGSESDAALDLAVALLEDLEGMIEIDSPFTASTRSVTDAAIDALRVRLTARSATPFIALGKLVGLDAEALRLVRFEAGAAALNADALVTIDGLATALRQRPRLGLHLLGGFNASVDRDALARQQIELHVLLATSRSSLQARPASVDFSSPRIQDVLDEFARERLAPPRLTALARGFRCSAEGDLPCPTEYYMAVFDTLVANETISDTALARLGRFRAQSVADALSGRGIPDDRVEVGTPAVPGIDPRLVGVEIEATAKR